MSVVALENAKALRERLLKRKADLHEERIQIDSRLDEVERFLALYESFSTDPQPFMTIDIQGKQIALFDAKSGTKQKRRNSPKEEVAGVTREIILERGRPISRKDLFPLLVARGLTIEGEDPDMVLSTMLWRMRRNIVRLKKGGGYWLAERPWEPAGYVPEQIESHDPKTQYVEPAPDSQFDD